MSDFAVIADFQTSSEEHNDNNQNPKAAPASGKSQATKPGKRKHQISQKRNASKANLPVKPGSSKTSKIHLSTYPIQLVFMIQTSFLGYAIASGLFYKVLTSRDMKIEHLFTIREFQYVTLLSSYYRAMNVCAKSSANIFHGMSRLRESISNVLLPEILCSLIEILGKVKLSTGIEVVPYLSTVRSMERNPEFVNPKIYLTAEQQEEAADVQGFLVHDGVILKVITGLSRALKGIVTLRPIKDDIEGRIELIASYKDVSDFICPYSPEVMDIDVCTLGALMRFRHLDYEEYWQGLKLPMVQEAPRVNADLAFLTYLQKSLQH